MDRRQALQTIQSLCGSVLATSLLSFSMQSIQKRKIGNSGESLACVGLGTWQTFDVDNTQAARRPLIEVLTKLAQLGGQVVDSSPMYGSSEKVVGELSEQLDLNKKLFLAKSLDNWQRRGH